MPTDDCLQNTWPVVNCHSHQKQVKSKKLSQPGGAEEDRAKWKVVSEWDPKTEKGF